MAETTKIKGGGSTEERTPRARRTQPKDTAQPATAPLRGTDKRLRDSLMAMYAQAGAMGQMIASMGGNVPLLAASANVSAHAEAVADAWVELSKDNPRVRAMLEGFVQGSSVAALIGIHMAMVIPFLSAQGAVPAELGNMMLHPDAAKVVQEYVTRHPSQNGTGPA